MKAELSTLIVRKAMLLKRLWLHIAAAILFLILSGCASLPVDETVQNDNWPQEIPPRDYFVDNFEKDSENQSAQSQRDYLTWILRFYQGWALVPRGWNYLTDTVVDSVDPAAQSAMQQQMYSLGERISAEWAKNREHRTVNSKHLLVWKDALKIAIREGRQAVLADQVSTDVDNLLSRNILPDEIDLDRYLEGETDVAVEVDDEMDYDSFEEPFSDPPVSGDFLSS